MNSRHQEYLDMISAYLDGELNPMEVNELENYALEHEEFARILNGRKKELEQINAFIPNAEISKESLRQIAKEGNESLKNLMPRKFLFF